MMYTVFNERYVLFLTQTYQPHELKSKKAYTARKVLHNHIRLYPRSFGQIIMCFLLKGLIKYVTLLAWLSFIFVSAKTIFLRCPVGYVV